VVEVDFDFERYTQKDQISVFSFCQLINLLLTIARVDLNK